MKMLPDSGLPGMPLWDPPVPVWTGFILSTTNEIYHHVTHEYHCALVVYFCPSSQEMKFTPKKHKDLLLPILYVYLTKI